MERIHRFGTNGEGNIRRGIQLILVLMVND